VATVQERQGSQSANQTVHAKSRIQTSGRLQNGAINTHHQLLLDVRPMKSAVLSTNCISHFRNDRLNERSYRGLCNYSKDKYCFKDKMSPGKICRKF